MLSITLVCSKTLEILEFNMCMIKKECNVMFKFQFKILWVCLCLSRDILSCQILKGLYRIYNTGRATTSYLNQIFHVITKFTKNIDVNKSFSAAEVVNITSYSIKRCLKTFFFFMRSYINVDVCTHPIIYHKRIVIILEKFSLLKTFLCL